jgi:CHAT domain-containing protein
LWQRCIKPILDELRYPIQYPAEDLPRIWWIGTGLASSFPFHAASDRSAGVTESAYDRVISSYSPSIKALIHARGPVHLTAVSRSDRPKALIVTMPQTPDAKDLPGTSEEKSVVTAALGGPSHITALDQPDVATVMEEIQQCNIAHLACHGVSDQTDPSESGLLLQTAGTAAGKPRQDILRVREVCQAYLPRAEIAYLSACSTAENRAAKLVDEALHVVSGFQVAGFRHVIGCLWPSSDRVCVQVAKSFYSELDQYWRRGHKDRAVALAMHKAVKGICEGDEYGKRPLYWAQYVHFGA